MPRDLDFPRQFLLSFGVIFLGLGLMYLVRDALGGAPTLQVAGDLILAALGFAALARFLIRSRRRASPSLPGTSPPSSFRMPWNHNLFLLTFSVAVLGLGLVYLVQDALLGNPAPWEIAFDLIVTALGVGALVWVFVRSRGRTLPSPPGTSPPS